MGEDTRLQIVQCLLSGEYIVSDIAKRIGREHSRVSHHLGILRNSGVVLDSREGKFVVYKIQPSIFTRNNIEGRNVLDFNCCRIEFKIDSYNKSDGEKTY